MTCKGICNRFKHTQQWGLPKYAPGRKRCSVCEAFFKTEDVRCPCCHIILKTKPQERLLKIKHAQRVKKTHICIECGFQSRKGGKCWDDEDKCVKCASTKVTKSCITCGIINHNARGNCWDKGICGRCYRIEQRPHRYVIKKLCVCGEKLVGLRFSKRAISFNTGIKICSKCRVVFLVKDKYALSTLR